MLSGIGNGRLDARDPAVQIRCGQQETFLRQLILLDPELTQMGVWLAHALNTARERGIELTVRAGSTDTAPDQAGELGRAVLGVVKALPPGTKLTTSLFVVEEELVMTLVAPTPHLVSLMATQAPVNGAVAVHSMGDGMDLVEITVDLPAVPTSAPTEAHP